MKKRVISVVLLAALVLCLIPITSQPAEAASASDSGWEFTGDIGVRYAVNGVESKLMVTGQKYSIQFWLQNIAPYSISIPLAWDPSVARIIDPYTGDPVESGRQMYQGKNGFRVGTGCEDDSYDIFNPSVSLYWNGTPVYSSIADQEQGYPYLDQENGIYRFFYYVSSPNPPRDSQLILEVYFELIGDGDPNFHIATSADGTGHYDPAEPDGMHMILPLEPPRTDADGNTVSAYSDNYTKKLSWPEAEFISKAEYDRRISTTPEPAFTPRPYHPPATPSPSPSPSAPVETATYREASHMEDFPYTTAAEIETVILSHDGVIDNDCDYVVPTSLVSSVVNDLAEHPASSVLARMPDQILDKPEYDVQFSLSNIDDMARTGLYYLYLETPYGVVGIQSGLLALEAVGRETARLSVEPYENGLSFRLTLDGEELESFNGQGFRLILPHGAGRLPVSEDVLPGQSGVLPLSMFQENGGNVVILTPCTGHVDLVPRTAEPFSDTAHITWAAEAMDELAARKIINGMGDGRFAPEDPVTREQFATMIVKTYALYTKAAKSGTFTDVPAGGWAEPYIEAAAAVELVNGIGDGAFGYGQEISRQDLCVMAYRGLRLLGVELPQTAPATLFDDEMEISGYAKEAVYALSRAGIVNGVGDNRFAPLETANRAQAAKIMYGVLQLALDRF